MYGYIDIIRIKNTTETNRNGKPGDDKHILLLDTPCKICADRQIDRYRYKQRQRGREIDRQTKEREI